VRKFFTAAFAPFLQQSGKAAFMPVQIQLLLSRKIADKYVLLLLLKMY